MNSLSSYTKKIAFFALVLTQSHQADAIVMRHDVDKNEYLLDTVKYQSAIYGDICSATLIAPRWVLTASHCFAQSLGHNLSSFGRAQSGDLSAKVKKVHIHPQSTIPAQGETIHDFALLELEEPFYGIEPVPPYEKSDELGQTMKLAGYGYTGTGQTGGNVACFPCDLRGADNVVFEANEYHLRFKFEAPGESGVLPLEGVGGPGDSGGPVYVETAEGMFVAGVSSFGGNHYGDVDNYTRVSKHLDWMYEVMGDEYPGEYRGPLYSENTHQDVMPQYAETSGSGGALGWPLVGLFTLLLFRRKGRKQK